MMLLASGLKSTRVRVNSGSEDGRTISCLDAISISDDVGLGKTMQS